MNKRKTFRAFCKYDREFTQSLAPLVEQWMLDAKDYDDFRLRGHVVGKVLCNALVVHLSTFFKGDMAEVAEFISKGVNIDIGIIQKNK